VPQSGYDQIAPEYYDARHITSRNFDRATKNALADLPFSVPDGLVLELGAGRGRSTEFLNIPSSRIVQLDNSEGMLHLGSREQALLQLHADACKIPLVSSQFKAVTGFLVDPFLGLDCLAEAYRMLMGGGELLLTTPTKTWGEPLRKRLKINIMTTRFKLVDRDEIVILPSLLYPAEQIGEMLKVVGFHTICITDAYLPPDEETISPDITSVCSELNKNIFDLPIIHIIRARR
jgi:SAM-dependent methyltransferase